MDSLIIDDDATVIFLTTRLLRREGKPSDIITSFISPVEAVEFFKRRASTDALPDVVFLDLNMPLVDGWGVLDALQSLEGELEGRCAIYILTSSLASADVAQAQLYPMVAGFLHKPLDGERIRSIQDRHQAVIH